MASAGDTFGAFLQVIHHRKAVQQLFELGRIGEILQVEIFFHDLGLLVDRHAADRVRQAVGGPKHLRQRLVGQNVVGGGDVSGLALEIQRQPHAGIGIALLRFQVLLEILVLRFQKLIPLLRPYFRETGDVALLVEIERRRDLGKARVALGVREALGVGQVGTENLRADSRWLPSPDPDLLKQEGYRPSSCP